MRLEDEIKGRFRNEYHKGLINLTYTTRVLGYRFIQDLKKIRYYGATIQCVAYFAWFSGGSSFVNRLY